MQTILDESAREIVKANGMIIQDCENSQRGGEQTSHGRHGEKHTSRQKVREEDEDQTANRSRMSDAAGGGHDNAERLVIFYKPRGQQANSGAQIGRRLDPAGFTTVRRRHGA
jgi:hypothetical protein